MFAGKFGRCVALARGDILPMRVFANETKDFRKGLPPTNHSLAEQCSPNNTLLLSYLNKSINLSESELSKLLPAVRDKQECEVCAAM